MTTFDGWETQFNGIGPLYGQDVLAHFRTPGSKNGVRRFQMKDGTWTPLGLKERKEREGWGAGRAERKAARIAKKIERRDKRKARREEFAQKRAMRNVKNLSDEELQQRIKRIKMETEYKELTRNPVVKSAEKLVTAYLKNKEAKANREMKKAELYIKEQEAKQKTIASKAALTNARASIIDNLTGGSKRKQAKANLISTKADKTIRGALRGAISGVIKKEGERFVNDMGKESIVMRGGKKVKSVINNGRERTVDMLKDQYVKDTADHERRMREKQKKRDRAKGANLRG